MRSRLGLRVVLAGISIVTAAGALASSPQAQKDDKAATPEVELARGNDDLNHHRYEQAEADFRAALALNPQLMVRARFPLAVTLFALQKRDEARAEFEAVRSQTGDDPNVNYYLGRLDLEDGKFDSAIHNLAIAASKPPFPDAAYYLGPAYLKQRDFDAAGRWLHKAAALAPDDPRVPEALGRLYQAKGMKAESEAAFAESSNLRDANLTATRAALDCDQSLAGESPDPARGVCQKLLDPGNFGDLITLSLLYGRHHDYADALEPFRLATGLDPDSYEAQFDLGLTYFRLKEYPEARAPLEKAAAFRPDVFEINAPLGATLYALGDDAAAYPVLDRANRLNPQNPDAALLLFNVALNLAARSMQVHDSEAARRYLLRAAEARPDDPLPHRQLAEVYEASGDRESAQHERDTADHLASQ